MEVLRTNGRGGDAHNQDGINALNDFAKIVLIIDPTSKSDLDALSDDYKRKVQLLTREGKALEGVDADLGRKPVDVLPSVPGTIKDALSGRQRDVLSLIVQGMSNKEMARALSLAEGTIKIHVAALFGKLGVHRRAAVAVAGARFLSGAD